MEMSVAEYHNQAKFVPRDESQDASGPMILKRRMTLTKDQILKARQKESTAV